MRKITSAVISGLFLSFLNSSGAFASPQEEFIELRDAYLAKFRPLWLRQQAAWWEATTTGADEAFARKTATERALVELHADRETFGRLKSIKDSGQVKDPVLQRELDVMYRSFLAAQGDPELQQRIVELENQVEQAFNTHRSRVGDRTLTENEIRDILATTRDSAEAEKAWKAYMAVGGKVDGVLQQLVSLRNQVARQLGFSDFFEMRLALQEIDRDAFFALFDELDTLTREPFAEVKRDFDARAAARFGIEVGELRPWHFGDLFFQEVPPRDDVDLDGVFRDTDLVEVSKRYYASMGLPCTDILARSDLYERPGKTPHAFANDMDREGDVRIMCNLKPNLYWANTLVHELAHAVYDKNIRRDLPFLLRQASHSITTEGMAMMFGAMVKTEDWLTQVLKLESEPAKAIARAARTALREEKLLFSRWTQVVVRFEHGMYTEPDQDLGKLWWDLKKRYQLLTPPETTDRPDYAAKVHILTYPVYYHSYMMGDLFAAQVRQHMARNVMGLDDPLSTCFYSEPKAGAYLREQVFGPGNLHPWDELTRRATGEPLTAKYFAEQFVK